MMTKKEVFYHQWIIITALNELLLRYNVQDLLLPVLDDPDSSPNPWDCVSLFFLRKDTEPISKQSLRN